MNFVFLVIGPSGDHTYQNSSQVGNYMFVDSSTGGFYGRAELVSPMRLGSLSDTCQISFFFQKSGTNGGIMQLFLVPPGVSPTSLSGRIPVWNAFGKESNSWQQAVGGLGRRNPGYQLIFEAIRVRRSGDMAIDDITFSNCALGANSTCASNQFKCKRGSCVDLSMVCDFNDDCGDRSDEMNCSSYQQNCNFETDLCNWQQDYSDDFQWTWQQGKTATSQTGPGLDHTYGNSTGHYIYIETSSPRRLGDKARLKSPVFQSSNSGTCRMRFFYHMHGVDVNLLNVYIEKYEMGPLTPVWTKNGSQVDSWLRADVALSSSMPFRVVFEGVRGNGFHGDIAIDDVSFTLGCQTAQIITLPAQLTTPGIIYCSLIEIFLSWLEYMTIQYDFI